MNSPKRLTLIAVIALAPLGVALPAAAHEAPNVDRKVVHGENGTLRAARFTLPNGETVTRTRAHGTNANGDIVNAKRVKGPEGGVRSRKAVTGADTRRVTNHAHKNGVSRTRTRIRTK